MKEKKSFINNNPALQFISAAEAQAQQTPQAQGEQEAHAAHNAHEAGSTAGEPISKRTQGKKGEKLPRMNMAFAPENYDHIQLMGRLMGCSATEYVNRLISADRAEQGDIVKQALKLFREVKNK